jgi:hypothetical protein
VAVGVVTRSNPAVGSIEVRVQVGEHLEFLHDVLLTSNTNLDLLSYETSSGLWKNKSFSTLGLLTSATAASTYAAIASTNTFTASQVIEVTDNSNAALRVTQLGTGNAFVVEDSTNPDATAFGITADGRVGINGSADANYTLKVNTHTGTGIYSNGIVFVTGSSNSSPRLEIAQTGNGGAALFSNSGTGDAVRITNTGTGVSFRVNDVAADTTPFIVDTGGNVGVKTASPSTDFEVNGNAKFTTGNITTAPAAADSSSLIPTTAWVQAEVPAASTTAAGKVELATDAEAVAGTSATLAVTPQSFLIANLSTGYYSNLVNGGAGATAGASAGSASSDAGGRVFTGTTSGAYALRRIGPGSIYPLSIGKASGVINYDKRVCLSVLMTSNQYVSDSNIRCLLGKSLTDNNGNLDGKGIGVRVTGTGVLELQVHDGTTLTNVSSSFTPVANQAFDVLVDSDGSGNVTLYVNGSSVATSSAGPTGNSVNTLNAFHFEAETTDTLVAQTIAGFSRHQLFFGR